MLATAGSNPGSKLSATVPNPEQLEPAQDSRNALSTTTSFRLGAGRSQVQILSPRLNLLQMSLNSTPGYRGGAARGANLTGWLESGRLQGATISADLRPPGHLHPVDLPHPARGRVTDRAALPRIAMRAVRRGDAPSPSQASVLRTRAETLARRPERASSWCGPRCLLAH